LWTSFHYRSPCSHTTWRMVAAVKRHSLTPIYIIMCMHCHAHIEVNCDLFWSAGKLG
jgi:hypothetical protein